MTPGYIPNDPQPSTHYSADPIPAPQYQPLGNDYPIVSPYLPIPQYSPTSPSQGYHGAPQAVVYEPKEDPYPLYQTAQPLLKYHLIHQGPRL